MIPRYRAWNKEEKRLILSEDTLAIDYENEEIETQKIYFEDGLPVGRDIYTYDFDAVVLMQSTGMLDKNWREIFEGDIIAINLEGIETPITAKVFQNKKIGILMFHAFEDNEDVPMVELLEGNSVEFAIIGNIWEDPELAEVSHD
jgi:uncharacterized phage protein (TIGR01671 family)